MTSPPPMPETLHLDSVAPAIPETARADRRDRKFRPDIEGLRAVAVLLVVLSHAGLSWLPGGFVGVDVFFVISGYLITGILLREVERSGRLSIVNFYARRVRRILPLAAFATIVTVISAYPLLGTAEANRVADDGLWTGTFLANYHFAAIGTNYFDRGNLTSPLQHFWSLGVEEQFYIVWPLLLLLCAVLVARVAGRRAERAVVVTVLSIGCVASLIWSVHTTASDPTGAYFSPFTRAYELGIGALVACLAAAWRRVPAVAGVILSAIGAAAIGYAATQFDAATPFPNWRALVPALGAAAIIIGGTSADAFGVSRALSVSPMAFIGVRSYGFYLWHFPFLIVVAGYVGHALSLGANIGLLAGAFALACVTYLFIEHPVRESAWLKSRTSWLSVGIGVALVAAVLVTAQLELRTHQVSYHPTPTKVQFP